MLLFLLKLFNATHNDVIEKKKVIKNNIYTCNVDSIGFFRHSRTGKHALCFCENK